MSGRDDDWQNEDPLVNVPRLTDRSVHVWCCSLDDPPLPPDRLLDVLSAREREHSKRYVFPRDRTRSAASRGLLRCLLGAHLNVRPEEVELRFGTHGKPKLARQHESSGLTFNVAHSDELVLYAMTRGREIGVDVERMRAMPDAAEVARRFFAKSEIEALLTLPAGQLDEAFFVCWTRKEAYVKARGVGLALPLDEFEVRLDRGEGSDRIRIPSSPAQAAVWSVHDVRPRPGFVGALAVSDRNVRLRCRWWIR